MICSAEMPDESASVTLSRVSVPTKRLGRITSQRTNRRRMEHCNADDVYAYTCQPAQAL